MENRDNIEMSFTEKKVFDFLINENILFQREYTTDTLKNNKGYNLYIDFYLPNEKIALEINGLHHYQPVTTYSGNNEYRYQIQINNDASKRKWCKDNGISIIEYDIRNPIKFFYKLVKRRVAKKKLKKNKKGDITIYLN
jgi:very-short-patch-repair endonuclease